MTSTHRWTGWAAAVVTVLIWTSFIIVARAAADRHLLPWDIAFLRMVGAGLILLPWAWWRTRAARRKGLQQGSLWGFSPLPLRQTVQAGFFGGLLYPLLAYAGFFFAPAAHASVLMPGSLPLWTSLLLWLIFRQSLDAQRVTSLALIVVGDLLVGGMSLWAAFQGGSVWVGDLLFMASSLCWSAYSVTARHHRLDAIEATMAITAFAVLCFVPAYGLAAWLGVIPSHLGTAPVSELLFHAVMQGWGSVVISGITFTLMLSHYGAVRSTMITALVPGLSALGAVPLLGEPLHWNLLLGLALVTLGIVWGVRPAAVATHSEPSR